MNIRILPGSLEQAESLIFAMNDRITELEAKIAALKQENEVMGEALGFYANKEIWRKEFGNRTEYNAHRIKDDFYLDENFTPVGGKRARETLAKVKEIKSGGNLADKKEI